MGKCIKFIIMGVAKFLKKHIALLSLAMSNVEKDVFGQKGNQVDAPIGQERRHSQGTLMDSLKNNIITTEVQEFRWRMYKILQATEGVTVEIIGYDDNNTPITRIRKTDKKRGLENIKIDSSDKYGLEMVVDNTPIVTSGNDIMDNENIDVLDLENVVINKNDKGEIVSATHGEIKGEEYFATTKGEVPIKIHRECLPKFEIETYTKKLHIKKIGKTERLLEFFVSMYPDEDNRRSRFFISDVKKAIENHRNVDMLDILKVGFITYKTLGVDDFLEYQYEIKEFDKIIEFNGYYVIKFKAEVIIDGREILAEFRVDELDEKYKNKEKRKQK